MVEHMRSQTAESVSEGALDCEQLQLKWICHDLSLFEWLNHPPRRKLDLDNAPFSAKQRKWLEQFTQWACPPPSTTCDGQLGSTTPASTAVGPAASDESESV